MRVRQIDDDTIGVLESEELVLRALAQIQGELRAIVAGGQLDGTQLRGAAEGGAERKGSQAEHTGSESSAKDLSNHRVRSATSHLIYGVAVGFSTQRREPRFAERGTRAHFNVVPGIGHRKRQREIRGWQSRSAALRPFDEPEVSAARPFAKSERLELGGVPHAIEIDVHGRERPGPVQLDEGVGGTAHLLRHAERAQETPREGRLAGTELTAQVEHRERLARRRPGAGEPSAEILRVLRRGGAVAHARRQRFTQLWSSLARSPASTPTRAAVQWSRHCARIPAIAPVSTSPLPAVAIPGLPRSHTPGVRPRAPTRVPAPFSTIVPWKRSMSRSSAASRSRWMSSALTASSLPASPGCGVRIQSSRAGAPCSASRFSASASTTSGLPLFSTALSAATAHAERPSPGPTAMTSTRPSTSASAVSPLKPTQMSSGRPAAIAATFSGATATVTSPAPTRRHASPASRAAPGMPLPLPTISTRPKLPLLADRARRGSASWISASTMRVSRGARCADGAGASSRSSKNTAPANSGPSPTRSPVFMPTKVTVASARTASPSATPASLSSPEGTSSANTGLPLELIARITCASSGRTSPSSPVPNNASTMTSPDRSRSAEKGCPKPPLALKSSYAWRASARSSSGGAALSTVTVSPAACAKRAST